MTDLVRKKLLALLRIINYKVESTVDSGGLDWEDEHLAIVDDPEVTKVLRSLSKKEKGHLHDILKAMTLITSGNVESVRNPSKYQSSAAGSFTTIYSFNTIEILNIMGIDYSGAPTRQDYELAKKLLPIIGSDYLTDVDFFQDTGVANLARNAVKSGDRRLLGYKATWRGLNNMDNKIVAAALKIGSNWDIQRGVSTTTDVMTAVDFAGMDIGYENKPTNSSITDFIINVEYKVGIGAEKTNEPSGMLFKFLNPRGSGMIARRLSKYGAESETILSGKATIEGWSLQFLCRDSSLQTANGLKDHKHVTINSVDGTNNMIVRDRPSAKTYKTTKLVNLNSSDAYRTARLAVSRGTIDIDGVQHKINTSFALILQARIS